MDSKPGSDRRIGLRVLAIGLTVLAIAVVWSSLMLDQRRGLLITLLAVSLALVLLGAILAVAAAPSESEAPSQARRTLQAAVPVIAVAVSAVLATALFWISNARVSLLG